jgi:hypothetical protein
MAVGSARGGDASGQHHAYFVPFRAADLNLASIPHDLANGWAQDVVARPRGCKMAMVQRRNIDRAHEDSMLDPFEQALRVPNHPAWQRRLTVGLLMFSVAFCTLVFHAGWKEVAALEKCALHGISSCHAIASKLSHAP